MPRALWLADVISDAGLTVRPFPGWETRGKTDFAPLGVIVHHTVTKPTTPDAVVDSVLALTGSSSAPPPLANYSTNRDGSVSIIAAGTANHGGAGTWNGVSGNRFWLGDEMKNLGSGNPASGWYEPWPPLQVEAAMRAAAACLKHIAADESWLVGHKEYATPPGRKVDPHTLSMSSLRESVKAIMEGEAMTPEQMATVLAAIGRVPGETWAYGHKVDPATGAELHPSAYQMQIRTKSDTMAIRTQIGALDLQGVSEEELAAAVAELVAVIHGQPDEFVAALKAAL